MNQEYDNFFDQLQQARAQIEQKQYLEAIDNLDKIIQSYVSHISRMSDESLDKWQSELQNMKSIPSWDK